MKKITFAFLAVLSIFNNLMASESSNQKQIETSQENQSSDKKLETDKQTFKELIKSGEVTEKAIDRDTDCQTGGGKSKK